MKKEILEQKPWVYMLFKDRNNIYQLSISVPCPAPGFDVTYELTEMEIEKYNRVGIDSLKERIKDMNQNRKECKIIAWR